MRMIPLGKAREPGRAVNRPRNPIGRKEHHDRQNEVIASHVFPSLVSWSTLGQCPLAGTRRGRVRHIVNSPDCSLRNGKAIFRLGREGY